MLMECWSRFGGLDGRLTKFEYDALGRRTSKITGGVIYRYLWEGNRIIHEWNYPVSEAPQIVVEESGKCVYNKDEPLDNLITWVYERGNFAPTAKLTSKGNYSIISDYIGRAVQAYDTSGKRVWSTDYDIYGNLTDLKGERSFVPFRQAGQYEDSETGLYYNRFRYYDPALGTYLSKDPIGLEGGNPNLYGYVFDSNSEVDVLGLDLRPESKYLTGQKHGIKQQTSDVIKMTKPNSRGVSRPIGKWGNKADLAYAGGLADLLEPGGFYDFPVNSNSKSVVFHSGDTTPHPATLYRLRNNGNGTFHGFPIDGTAELIRSNENATFKPGKSYP